MHAVMAVKFLVQLLAGKFKITIIVNYHLITLIYVGLVGAAVLPIKIMAMRVAKRPGAGPRRSSVIVFSCVWP